ncbi:MAG: sigma-70 family RNA polymerase sigma factor [Variibacter sp.]|nr:sigma-70 family RNA polymerase sigma factor [Variibacter sp.]
MRQREQEWAALMRAANSGDGAAYERLLRELSPALRAVARRATLGAGAAVDAEDIVQETLIAIHLKRHTWRPTEPIGPWVRAIARHKFIDALRRRGRRIQVPIEDFEHVLPAEEAAPEFPRRDLERHLPQLAPRQREVIQSIALDGNSIRATATRFGMSEGAVRVALHRAVAALAAIINKAAP